MKKILWIAKIILLSMSVSAYASATVTRTAPFSCPIIHNFRVSDEFSLRNDPVGFSWKIKVEGVPDYSKVVLNESDSLQYSSMKVDNSRDYNQLSCIGKAVIDNKEYQIVATLTRNHPNCTLINETTAICDGIG